MITVEITDKQVKIEGHAGGKYGQDIVCASVSALWYAVTEKLRKDGVEFQMHEESGNAEFVIDKPNQITKTILDVMCCGVGLIAENYPKKIFFKNMQGVDYISPNQGAMVDLQDNPESREENS